MINQRKQFKIRNHSTSKSLKRRRRDSKVCFLRGELCDKVKEGREGESEVDDGHSDGHKEQTLKYKNLSGKSELEKYNVANISKRNIFVLGLSVDE